MDKHPIYRLRLPQKYECVSVGNAIIGNELVTEFGNAGTLGMLSQTVGKAKTKPYQQFVIRQCKGEGS
jgi:hypothetical protein